VVLINVEAIGEDFATYLFAETVVAGSEVEEVYLRCYALHG